MQITGNILNIVSDGGYAGSHGYIFTYQVTIDDGSPDGITGQIGSKKDSYPKNIGDEITVNSTTNQHGTSFKTVFNQGGGNGGGGGRPQNNQPPQQNQGGGTYTPPPQAAPRDYTAEARGKVTHGLVCAGIASKQLDCKTAEDVEMWTGLIMAAGESQQGV